MGKQIKLTAAEKESFLGQEVITVSASGKIGKVTLVKKPEVRREYRSRYIDGLYLQTGFNKLWGTTFHTPQLMCQADTAVFPCDAIGADRARQLLKTWAAEQKNKIDDVLSAGMLFRHR